MSKGLSSVKTLTAKEIAKKHNLPLAVIAKKIAAGVKVEKEHTKSTRQANEIARDHLSERPDYYDKLHKMEKTKVVKEETTTTGIGGLGFKTGTPAIDDDNEYVSTNALAYDPLNGARLDFIKKIHNRLHKEIGFNYFDPTNKNHSNKELSEARLNELGEYDNKGGTKDAEGLTDPHPRVLRKDVNVKEDLRKWFREKWVRFDTKGNIKGPCAREEGEGKPKCQPLASARSMSKDERAKSARRKRREDPVANRPGKGGKPIMVRTDEETLLEKNVPTNPELWARAKSQAKSKFDVYPSAYANGWAAKWYKSKGGGWKSAANESVDEACWSGYVAKGMKKKGNKMVPNCVPVEEQSPANRSYTERPMYEKSTGNNPMPAGAERGIYQEATYQGKEVPLNKPMKGDVKKSKVYVDPDGDGKAQKINFGDKKLSIKKDQPNRKKSYCARSGGITGKKDVTSANYWSRKAWNCEEEIVNEISAELVGKVSNARFFRGEAPSKTLNRAIVKKFIESGKKKKEVKEDANRPDRDLEARTFTGATGTTHTVKEETKMDNKELINEALDCILEDNLSEMKDNLLLALQEKTIEKLEERKKEIAASYFAQ